MSSNPSGSGESLSPRKVSSDVLIEQALAQAEQLEHQLRAVLDPIQAPSGTFVPGLYSTFNISPPHTRPSFATTANSFSPSLYTTDYRPISDLSFGTGIVPSNVPRGSTPAIYPPEFRPESDPDRQQKHRSTSQPAISPRKLTFETDSKYDMSGLSPKSESQRLAEELQARAAQEAERAQRLRAEADVREREARDKEREAKRQADVLAATQAQKAAEDLRQRALREAETAKQRLVEAQREAERAKAVQQKLEEEARERQAAQVKAEAERLAAENQQRLEEERRLAVERQLAEDSRIRLETEQRLQREKDEADQQRLEAEHQRAREESQLRQLEQARIEQERLASVAVEQARLEVQRAEADRARLELERLESARRETERARLEKEQADEAERSKNEAAAMAEKERLDAEETERVRLRKQKAEADRARLEQDRAAATAAAAAAAALEAETAARKAREQTEAIEKARLEKEQQESIEKARLEKEQAAAIAATLAAEKAAAAAAVAASAAAAAEKAKKEKERLLSEAAAAAERVAALNRAAAMRASPPVSPSAPSTASAPAQALAPVVKSPPASPISKTSEYLDTKEGPLVEDGPVTATGPSLRLAGKRKGKDGAGTLKAVLAVDEANLDPVLRALSTLSSSDRWVVLGYKTSGLVLTAQGTREGTDALEEVRAELKRSEFMYAIVATPKKQRQPANADSSLEYVLIKWAGAGLAPAKRGKFSQHMEQVTTFLSKYFAFSATYSAKTPPEVRVSDTAALEVAVDSETEAEAEREEREKAERIKRVKERAGAQNMNASMGMGGMGAAILARRSTLAATERSAAVHGARDPQPQPSPKAPGGGAAGFGAANLSPRAASHGLGANAGGAAGSAVPEWKQKLEEKRRMSAMPSSSNPALAAKGEASVPAWKLAVAAQKDKKGGNGSAPNSPKSAGGPHSNGNGGSMAVPPIATSLRSNLRTPSPSRSPDDLSPPAEGRARGHSGSSLATPPVTRSRGASVKRAEFRGKSGIKLEDRDHMVDTFQSFVDEASSTNWVIMSYKDGKTTVGIKEQGNGGFDEFKAKLDPEQIFFVLYSYLERKTEAQERQLNKIAFITWIGMNVKALNKAMCNPHKIDLYEWTGSMIGFSNDLHFRTVEEMEKELPKLMDSTGAKVVGVKSGGVASSQELLVSDINNSCATLADVQNDGTPTNWCAFGYDPKADGRTMCMVAKGMKGLDELVDFLKAPQHQDQVYFTFLKTFTAETGYGGAPKVAFIVWLPPNIGAMHRASAGVHKEQFLRWATGYISVNSEFQASSADQLDGADIRGKLTGSKGLVAQDGQFHHNSESATGGGPSKKFGGGDSTLQFTDIASVKESIKELRDNKSGTTWLVFGYDDDACSRVCIRHKGSGPVDKWQEWVEETNVLFMLTRVKHFEHHGIAKGMMVTWIGSKVATVQKARSAGHHMFLYEFFQSQISIGGQFLPSFKEECTDQAILEKITGGGDVTTKDATPSVDEERWSRTRADKTKQPVRRPSQEEQFTGHQMNIPFSSKGQLRFALDQLSHAQVEYVKLLLRGKKLQNVRVSTGKGLVNQTLAANPTRRSGGSALGASMLNLSGISEDHTGGLLPPLAPTNPTGSSSGVAASGGTRSRQNSGDMSDLDEEPPVEEVEDAEVVSAEEFKCMSEEWRVKHLDENVAAVYVLAFTSSEHGYGHTTKFVYFLWVGKKVRPFAASRAVEINHSILRYVQTLLHITNDFQAVLPDQVTRESILEKLTGSRVRGAEMAQSDVKSEYKELGKGKKSELSFASEADMADCVRLLTDATNAGHITWFLMEYVEGTIDVLRMVAKGSAVEPFAEYKLLLKDDKQQFVVNAIRHSYETLPGVDLSKAYYGLLRWQGLKVPVIEKALGSHHWNSFAQHIAKELVRFDCNVQGTALHADAVDDITLKSLKASMNLYD